MDELQSRLLFKKQGELGRFLDTKMEPVMYWLQGTKYETPQRTHFWNNQKFHRESFDFNTSLLAYVAGDPAATKRKLWGFIPRFHMPRFGGWSKYVVLVPSDSTRRWYVGWKTKDAFGISMIPINGHVRLGLGPDAVEFFAFTHYGLQIQLEIVGFGRVGSGGEFCQLPFL